MGKHIYESHMGGVYCSENFLDYDYLYCDSCGDSDHHLGYVNDLASAWDLLKPMTDTFDEYECNNCPYDGDYEYCEANCEGYQESGGYNLPYIMQFLAENFKCNKLHYIYLISKHNEDNNYILVDCKPKGLKFGEKYALPYNVCPFEEYVPMMARSLISFLDGPCKNLKEIAVKKNKKGYIHIFECVEELDDEYPNENWRDSASHRNNSWYGYMEKNKIMLIDEQKDLIEYLKV